MYSHSPLKLGDEVGSVRAISAMDNKRYRDAGGAKSASLSTRWAYTPGIPIVRMGAFYRSLSFGHSVARQVCLHPITHTPCVRGGDAEEPEEYEDNRVSRVLAR